MGREERRLFGGLMDKIDRVRFHVPLDTSSDQTPPPPVRCYPLVSHAGDELQRPQYAERRNDKVISETF